MKLAKRTSWGIGPFPDNSISIPIIEYKYYILEEFNKIKIGYIPGQMEDKWFIFFEDDFLYCCRSWTHTNVYKIKFKREKDIFEVTSLNLNPEIYKDKSKINLEYEFKMAMFLIDAILLGYDAEFPINPNIQINGNKDYWMYRHCIVGNTNSNNDT